MYDSDEETSLQVLKMKPADLSKHCAGPLAEQLLTVAPMRIEVEKGPETERVELLNQKSKVMNPPCPGSKGLKILLLTNHFKVSVAAKIPDFYHYNVSILHDNGKLVGSSNLRRKVIAQAHETYKSELAEKSFAYDGFKNLYTVGCLPRNNLDFVVVLNAISLKRVSGGGNLSGKESPCENDQKRHRLMSSAKTFKIQMSFVATISTQQITNTTSEQGPEKHEGLKVLDTILRQHAAKQEYLVLRQSYFSNDSKNFMDLGGGVFGCRGFSSRFQDLQGGLYLNFDVTTTTIVQPGPVINFLISHQNVSDPFKVDWLQAKRTLKNLRIKVAHNNREWRITGLSEKSCKQEKFWCKLDGGSNQVALLQQKEMTVYDYFTKVLGISLTYSADLPCIDAGKPCRPTYFPVELCSLVSLQHYKKALTNHQRRMRVSKSSIQPEELYLVLTNELRHCNYNADPLLLSCGLSISNSYTQVEGRVLSAPRLKVGNNEDLIPRNASWSFKDKKLVEPKRVQCWAVVNFSSQHYTRNFCQELAKLGAKIGVTLDPPVCVFEENPQYRKKPPHVRVEKMCEQISSKVRNNPLYFVLCFLSEKRQSPLYGYWKWKSLAEVGVPNQCLANDRVDESYLLHVLLKINAKLGGFNTRLASEMTRTIPWVSKIPTMILGMEVMPCVDGQSELPPIAAVVGSRQWPSISCYRASIHTQTRNDQMMDSLFRQVSQQEDKGMIRELLMDFYASSGQKKPAQIIIFRNGLSTTQFNQLLNNEMDQIFKACKLLDETWCPKFTLIISERSHHTKFIKASPVDNVPPGTVVDKKICHAKCNNFFLCPHIAKKGTARPTHYHVLLDEIGFSSDEIQELIHCLSYVYQKSTTAISEVAPIRYARLAAAQMLELFKSDKTRKMYPGNRIPSPSELPKLHKDVRSSMFFC
ncbi:protein argonaute 4A-like [Coffea eugenioides]|uniref:protein argonaute 4A-like n=1 Tax=Coffea eugenioides TaxID=49369 RepID=UPI000F615DF4|nr:protein argonaute 4A-like [Coffea eugenioides]